MKPFSFGDWRPGRLVVAVALAVGFTLLPLCAVAVAQTGGGGRGSPEEIDVRLKSGEVIEGAAYKADYRFKVLKLTLDDGGTRSVSFGDIAIITSAGVNFTPSILGSEYVGESLQDASAPSAPVGDPDVPAVPDGGAATDSSEDGEAPALTMRTTTPGGQDAWLSEQEEAYREAWSPAWRVAVRAAGNYSFPFGDFYEGIASGVGFEGDLMFAINNEAGVRLSVSKAGLRCEEDLILFVSEDPEMTIIDQSPEFSALRFAISYMRHWPLTSAQQQEDCSMLYAYAGLGLIRHEFSGDITLLHIPTGDTGKVGIEGDDNYFLTTYGGGLVKSVSPRFGVDLSVNLDVAWVGTDEYGSASYALSADIRGGLVMFF